MVSLALELVPPVGFCKIRRRMSWANPRHISLDCTGTFCPAWNWKQLRYELYYILCFNFLGASYFNGFLKNVDSILLYQGWDFGDGEPPAGDSPCGSLVDSGHVDSAPVGASHRLQTGDHPLTLVALVLEETHQPVACCGSGSRLHIKHSRLGKSRKLSNSKSPFRPFPNVDRDHTSEPITSVR